MNGPRLARHAFVVLAGLLPAMLCASCLAVATKDAKNPPGKAAGSESSRSGPKTGGGKGGGKDGGGRAGSAGSAAAEPTPTVGEKAAGFERLAGLLTVYLDRAKGKVWLEVPPPGARGV